MTTKSALGGLIGLGAGLYLSRELIRKIPKKMMKPPKLKKFKFK